VRKLIAAVVAAVVLAGVVLAAVKLRAPPEEEEKPPAEGIVLKVITRHSTTIWHVSKEMFLKSDLAKKYNVVDIRFMGPNPTLWLSTIRKLGDIDIAWGGGPTLFDILNREGLLEPITDPETLKVIDELPKEVGGAPMVRYDEQGRPVWAAAAISSFGFIVNYNILEKYGLPEPKLWEDLGSIEFAKVLPKPVVAYARPTTSTSHTRIYQIILQKFGWEKGWALLARIAANGRPYGGSVEALTAVESGEVAVSIAIDFYGYSSEIEFPGTKYVLPFNESIVNGDPIALLKTSKHKEAAQAFIRFILSTEGQKIWLDKRINRMPVRKDVFDTPEGKARPDLLKNYMATVENIGIPFDDERALRTEEALRYYFDAVYADLHDLLVEVWSKLVKAYKEGKLTEEEFEKLAYEMGAPLKWVQNGVEYEFTEEYAASINEKLRDPAFASEMMKIWRDAAREKYMKLLEKIPG